MAKFKKIVKQVGSGAKQIGSSVAKGTGSLFKKYKKYTSPKAQQSRLNAQEKRLQSQVRIAEQKARVRKLQSQGGGNMLGGFQGIDMEHILGGGQPPKKGRGKPFNPFSQF